MLWLVGHETHFSASRLSSLAKPYYLSNNPIKKINDLITLYSFRFTAFQQARNCCGSCNTKHILIRLLGSVILLQIAPVEARHAEFIETRLRQAQADTVLNFRA